MSVAVGRRQQVLTHLRMRRKDTEKLYQQSGRFGDVTEMTDLHLYNVHNASPQLRVELLAKHIGQADAETLERHGVAKDFVQDLSRETLLSLGVSGPPRSDGDKQLKSRAIADIDACIQSAMKADIEADLQAAVDDTEAVIKALRTALGYK